MKKLLLIRHAKATHDPGYADFERPLTHSGIRDADMMASRIVALSVKPQHVVASPALRTMATANIFTQHLDIAKPETDLKIYEANELILLKVINGFDDKYDFIALVGHNPGISQILYYLTGSFQEMGTAGVALIELEAVTWAEVSGDTGSLVSYDSPKI